MSDLDIAAREIRVRFTERPDRPDDTIPLSWAEQGMCFLHEHYPEIFGRMMLHVMGIEKTGRGRRP